MRGLDIKCLTYSSPFIILNIVDNTFRRYDMNTDLQYYKGLPLRLIARKDYANKKAKRFVINDSNQNIWIPNKYLTEDGTINSTHIDWIFFNDQVRHKIAIAYGRVKK